MIYDEDTEEIDMALLERSGNVVKVDFKSKGARSVKVPAAIRWFQKFDTNTPWVMRILAVLIVILLSLLMV